MRYLRIIGAIFVGLALMLVPSFGATAAPGSPTGPTDVVITKIKMDSLTGWPKTSPDGKPITGADGTTTYNGGQIGNITGFFGAGATALPGVTFTYYKVSKTQYDAMMAAPASYDTPAEVAAYVGAAGTDTAQTNASGQVTVSGLVPGYYWFVENAAKTTPLVNASAAVPFGLNLPMIKADGSYWGTGTDALYVYPKNTTGNKPTVDKDVTNVGNDSDSAKVGDPVTWLILPTLPSDIATYKVLKFTDVIDSRLDYQNNVVVKNGATTMTAGTDYTITQPTVGSAGGTLIVEFTPAGIAKLTAGKNLQISFQTSINETAVVGTPIPNDVKLEYTNSSGVVGTPETVPPENQPEVWTGGKKFEKIVEGDATKPLAGAVFRVESVANSTGTPVVWTADMITLNKAAIDAGKFATDASGTASSAGNVPAVGSTVYVRSAADGTFEIKGLQGYEPTSGAPGTTADKVNTVSHPGTYQLVEVVAPAGYALLTSPIPFTVTKTTYTAPATGVAIGTANAAADTNNFYVQNKLITIPPTGGIGTVVFTIAGLALMGVAVVGLRRRRTSKA